MKLGALAGFLFIVCFAGALAGHTIYARLHPAPAPQPEPVQESAPVDARSSLDRAFTPLIADSHEAFLSFFQTLSKNENTRVLDQALARMFPDGVDAPGEREVLTVLSYVAQTLKLESSGRHLGSEVLAEGKAYCYGMARAFEALCRRMGLPARINAFHNFEYMQAHNMAEVYYDGQWRLFDPTYGVFFYDRADYDGSGRIPPARELFSGRVPGEHAFMVCETLWSGEYDPGWTVRALPDDFRYRGMFTLRELYDRVLAVAFPMVQSELDMSSFPITIDMGDHEALSIGAVDGKREDLEGRRANATYPRYHGTSFLGHVVMGPAFHTITFKADRPGRFRMTYHFLPRSRFDAMGTVELRDIIVDRHDSGERAWSVEFRLQDEEGIFLVVNRRHTAFVDAITVERLGE